MKFLRSSLALAGLFTLGLASTATAAVETYEIDPAHSSVAFRVRHLFTKIPGSFTKFSGTVVVDRDNPEKSSAQATIDATTINTANEKRDAHLKNHEFLDVTKFPTITFQSKSWKPTGPDTFDVVGDLTIHGVTKEVVVKTKALGFGKGMQPGSMVAGWEGTTTVNRRDFGVNGPPMLGQTVGDEVEITISLEAGLKKS